MFSAYSNSVSFRLKHEVYELSSFNLDGTTRHCSPVVYVSQEVAYSSTCLPLLDGGNPIALPFHFLATIRLILYSSWKTICAPFFIRLFLVRSRTIPTELKDSGNDSGLLLLE